ncbi:MAG: hypothetical protein AAF074_12215 [Pseudomonadota bacterium]
MLFGDPVADKTWRFIGDLVLGSFADRLRQHRVESEGAEGPDGIAPLPPSVARAAALDTLPGAAPHIGDPAWSSTEAPLAEPRKATGPAPVEARTPLQNAMETAPPPAARAIAAPGASPVSETAQPIPYEGANSLAIVIRQQNALSDRDIYADGADPVALGALAAAVSSDPLPDALDAPATPILATGQNMLANTASLTHQGGVIGTLLVRGDVHELQAIVQMNILQDGQSAESAPAAPNLTNQLDQRSQTFAAEDRGGSATDIVIELNRVDGDFFDIHSVAQLQWLDDRDIARMELTGHDHIRAIGLGGNEAANTARVVTQQSGVELAIVDGDYHSQLTIHQLNMLDDEDRLEGAADAPGGSNSLANDAAIRQIAGSGAFAPLDDALAAAADNALAGALDAPDLAALDLDGDGRLKVLHVTGDYWNIRSVLQVNALIDADIATVSGAPEPEMALAELGANTLRNEAAIIDAGTGARANHVAGERFSEHLIYAADIITGGDDGGSLRSLLDEQPGWSLPAGPHALTDDLFFSAPGLAL